MMMHPEARSAAQRGAESEGGRAATPDPHAPPEATQRPYSGAPMDEDTWAKVCALAARLRRERSVRARVGWALASLLSLPADARNALIDHLMMTWGRDTLLRHLEKTLGNGDAHDR